MYIDFAKKKGEGLQDPICVSPTALSIFECLQYETPAAASLSLL